MKPQSIGHKKQDRRNLSLGIILTALGLTYLPIPGQNQTVVVVSGTELQEVLQTVEREFEKANPTIQLELQFQGSQDIVNHYIDDKNDFTPTVLIPANGELLKELEERWRAQEGSAPFYRAPQPIAKTVLVAIAWSERGNALFPTQEFQWDRLQTALTAGKWASIGGDATWGSFDLVITDPTRSNSGQITLNLWSQHLLDGPTLTPDKLNTPAIQTLFSQVKKSVYQPPRSTDILLQEFIARGPNDADVGMVYESIALRRWQESAQTQDKPYHIYYPNPTIETISTGAIARRDVDKGTAKAAQQFLDFLRQPQQQKTFVQYGFRPVEGNITLNTVPNSPWSQRIPGAKTDVQAQTLAMPNTILLEEIKRLWQRS